MKKQLLCAGMWLVVTLSILMIVPSAAHAWNQSFHSLVAKKCLNVQWNYVASYNARIGSMVPDFAWYLLDMGWIGEEEAAKLHGDTTHSCLDPDDTTNVYEVASDLVPWWDYGSKYLVKGIGSHLCADVIAHNEVYGYVEERWIKKLIGLVGKDRREALHLALEFSVDALLVRAYGFQIADLLLPFKQAGFVEEVFETAIDAIRDDDTPGADLSEEFRKYVALMRVLEKAAAAYAPYLAEGKVDEAALSALEGSDLFEAEEELTPEGLEMYYDVLIILLQYPVQIHETITAKEMHWRRALCDSVAFCRDPTFCPEAGSSRR